MLKATTTNTLAYRPNHSGIPACAQSWVYFRTAKAPSQPKGHTIMHEPAVPTLRDLVTSTEANMSIHNEDRGLCEGNRERVSKRVDQTKLRTNQIRSHRRICTSQVNTPNTVKKPVDQNRPTNPISSQTVNPIDPIRSRQSKIQGTGT